MIGAMEDDVLYPEIQPEKKKKYSLIMKIIKEIINFEKELYDTKYRMKFPVLLSEKIVDLIMKEGIYELE